MKIGRGYEPWKGVATKYTRRSYANRGAQYFFTICEGPVNSRCGPRKLMPFLGLVYPVGRLVAASTR